MNFSDAELLRYSRQIILPSFGGAGQARVKAARIAVVGAGGVGAALIPALAGAGVGALTIIDDDRVAADNLHRQTLYREADVGALKAPRAADYIAARNAAVAVRPVVERLGADNVAELLDGHDLIVDGSDNFHTRLTVSDHCVARGLPLISAAAQQMQGQVALWTGQPCYRCFVGDAFDADDCDTCAELGVIGPLPGMVGQWAALLALGHLARGAKAGTLNLIDAAQLTLRAIVIPADPACRACRGRDGKAALA